MPAGTVINSSDFVVGVLARGRRITSTGNITTTETGVLRLDNIPVVAGVAYAIIVSEINMDTSVANDIASSKFRVSTSGAATTASTQIAQIRNTIDDAGQSNILSGSFIYPSSSSGTLSILMSLVRVQGTGNITIFASAVDILDMTVICLGTDPGDSGVVI